jgi:hypothetical protein
MEPVKLFEDNDSEVTPDTEQATPAHNEHLLATLAELHSGNMDWMLVERIRAHRAEFSSGSVGEEVGATLGALLGEIRAIFLTRWLLSSATRA